MPTRRPRLALWVLAITLSFGVLLSGCAPTVAPTLPPATQVSQPKPATAQPPAPPQAAPTIYPQPPTPQAQVGPTAPGVYPGTATGNAAVAAAPTAAAQPQAPQAEGPATMELLVLHTNDVMGEIDPCG